MDIKEQIESIVEKLQKDKALQAQFKKDPVKAVEKLLGVDLPDDMVEKVVAGVNAKLSLDDVSGIVGNLKKFLQTESRRAEQPVCFLLKTDDHLFRWSSFQWL